MDLLAWHNILFLSALAVGIIIVLGAAMGGFDLGDAHLEVEADVHAEADLDAKDGLLSVLDLGQIPFTVLLMVASLTFGLTGVAVSLVLGQTLAPNSTWLGMIALVSALVVMVILTARLARLIIRHIPASETYVSRSSDLVGCEATMFTKTFADVKHGGDVHRIECRSDDALAPGMRVSVVDYDPETKTYCVTPIPN